MSRWVEPVPEGSPLVLVLKDLNFQDKTINLGEPRGVGPCLVFLHLESGRKGVPGTTLFLSH